MYRIRAAATRYGLAAIWVVKEDGPGKPLEAALFRLERAGDKVSSRRVLWGDPARWSKEACQELERLLADEPRLKVRLWTLLQQLVSCPLKPGQETAAVALKEAPIVKGLLQGIQYDVDLSL